MPEQMISADSHMCEPPDLWTERIDAAFRERAPRIVKDPGDLKGSFFVCEELPPLRVSGAFAAGKTFDSAFMEAGMEDCLPGGWDPAERLKDMDADGRYEMEGEPVQIIETQDEASECRETTGRSLVFFMTEEAV